MEIKMMAPPDFSESTERLFQDVDRIFSTEEDLLQFAVENFSIESRVYLRDYLSYLIGTSVSDAELLKIWNSSKAHWLFGSASPLRLLLSKIRDRL